MSSSKSSGLFSPTALKQRIMKVPYIKASIVLDMLTIAGFATPRIGAYPSKVIEKG